MSENENHNGAYNPPTGGTNWRSLLRLWILGPPKRSLGAKGGMRYKTCEKCADSVGIINVISSAFLMIVKGFLGVFGNSTALIADAVHSGADLVSATMLMVGLKVAKRPADAKYPYGYGKVEYLVSVVIYLLLMGAAVLIFVEAINCIVHRRSNPPSGVTLLGAFLAILVNEMMYRQSYCAGTQLKSPSMIANAYEKRSDALTSIAVFFGILGAKLGFHFLDPAAAILVGCYIMKFSIEMLMDAFKGLIDSSLDRETVAEIRQSAKHVDGIDEVLTVRTREIGQSVWVDLEICVSQNIKMNKFEEIKTALIHAVSMTLGRPAKIEVYLKGTTE